jgi:hypothetical protein
MLILADLTGFEPAISSVTGRHVNHYTTSPSGALTYKYYQNGDLLTRRTQGFRVEGIGHRGLRQSHAQPKTLF